MISVWEGNGAVMKATYGVSGENVHWRWLASAPYERTAATQQQNSGARRTRGVRRVVRAARRAVQQAQTRIGQSARHIIGTGSASADRWLPKLWRDMLA
jgi:hypothetical protein